MKIMQPRAPFFGTICIYFVGVMLILVLTYPVAGDYEFGVLTAEQTVLVYVQMCSIIVMSGTLIALLAAASVKRRRVLRAALAFVLLTGVLGCYGILIPRLPPTMKEALPFGAMSAHFLRDFLGVKFSFVVGPLCGLLLGVCVLLQGGRRTGEKLASNS